MGPASGIVVMVRGRVTTPLGVRTLSTTLIANESDGHSGRPMVGVAAPPESVVSQAIAPATRLEASTRACTLCRFMVTSSSLRYRAQRARSPSPAPHAADQGLQERISRSEEHTSELQSPYDL